MKKSHIKIFSAILVAVLLLASVFTISIFADDEYVDVSFIHGNTTKKEPVKLGESITIPHANSKVDGEVYGWFDTEGNFYNCGDKIKPTKDTRLFCADGGEIALSGSLALSAYKGYSYIKLKSNITLDSYVTLPNNQILYLDLNGNSIDITTNAIFNENKTEEAPHGAFVGENSGIIFANSSSDTSTIKHTAGGSTAFSLNSLVSVSPVASADCLTFIVKENVKIIENMNLVSVQTDVSSFSGTPNISILGEVECGRLLRSNGINKANITIFEAATLISHGEYLTEDITTLKDLFQITIHGGDITLDGAGIIKDPSRMTPYIYGGTYSKDVTSFFPKGNYVFEQDENTKLYTFKKCNHAGPLVEHAVVCKKCSLNHEHCQPCTLEHEHCDNLDLCSLNHEHCNQCSIKHEHCQCLEPHTHMYCDTPRSLKHLCIYCNTEFLVEYENGVDHSLRMELLQAPVNTQEETKAGCYKTYCTNCDYSRLELAYPDPASVYVTVKFTEGDNVKEVRVPSSNIFSFDKSKKTRLISYSVDNVSYVNDKGDTVKVPVESIFYVEVPLGTTDLYGELRHSAYDGYDTEVGVFTNDYYLKEVELPTSIVNIEGYAFSNMANLETIIGIENITGSIGTKAFAQSTKSKFTIDYMVLNAESVGEYAFRNAQISTLTIGKNVSSISNYAFSIDETLANSPTFKKIAEIFVEGNDSYDGVKLSSVKAGMGSNHQFSDKAIVFLGHNYITTKKSATCISYGHDFHECQRCFHTYTDNYVEEYADHEMVFHMVPSTCQSYGFKGVRCVVCDIKIKDDVGGDLPVDKNNHTFNAGVVKIAVDPDGSFCTDPYYTLRKCGCGAIEEDIPENRSEIIEPPEGSDHNYKETVIVEATCGDYGKTRFTCKDCKYEYIQSIKPSGVHQYDLENKTVLIPATCATPESGTYTCSVCNNEIEYTLDGVFNTENHTKNPNDNGTIVSEPSSEYAGLKSFVCKDCGKTFTEEIPPIDNSIMIKIPFTDKTWFVTDQETINTALIVLFIAIPLIAGVIITFVFTFTRKKSKSAGYKFRFNTLKKESGSTKSVSEQLAEMNLTDELPPDVPITEDGARDDAAAWTAYVDAINSDYERTVELNLQNEEAEKENAEPEQSAEDAWKAYVEALNRDYEATMEIDLQNSTNEEKSFADMMEDTVIDLSVPTEAIEGETQQSDDEDDEMLSI